ncbi:hypothetical protein [Pseudoalteromonas rubra]|uniref:hypothetical protein n=1 Tax=Pseudoalteromonas rubra TaxID=43658 RepID=UPI0010298973|nr:hypothetical protein [Pseudoalteromonas rubra]
MKALINHLSITLSAANLLDMRLMALTLLSLEVAAFKRNHVTNLNTKCHFGACSVSAGRVDMVSAQREVWHTDPFEVLAHNGAIYVRGTT